MAEAADDLRKLLRVKVADDQDIKTAQQGLAESAYFFLALVQEAEGLGVSADEIVYVSCGTGVWWGLLVGRSFSPPSLDSVRQKVVNLGEMRRYHGR